MLYDRPYMRSDYKRRETTALTWILALTIGAFVIQSIFEVWFKMAGPFTSWFALSLSGLEHFRIWTPLSYALLHGGVLHILANLLGIYFIGRELLPVLGDRRFVGLYGGSVLLGGFAWLAVSAFTGTPYPLVGASAAAFALLTVFACFHPDRPITLLLFFILPVTMRPRVLALGAAGISLFCLLFLELPGRSASIAHSSHLGGMLAGWIYFRYLHDRTAEHREARPGIELPAWMRRKKRKVAAVASSYSVNVAPRVDVKAEVDRILDKINSHGFGALTAEERRILDDARDLLNKR